jgi:hypothetical protein
MLVSALFQNSEETICLLHKHYTPLLPMLLITSLLCGRLPRLSVKTTELHSFLSQPCFSTTQRASLLHGSPPHPTVPFTVGIKPYWLGCLTHITAASFLLSTCRYLPRQLASAFLRILLQIVTLHTLARHPGSRWRFLASRQTQFSKRVLELPQQILCSGHSTVPSPVLHSTPSILGRRLVAYLNETCYPLPRRKNSPHHFVIISIPDI